MDTPLILFYCLLIVVAFLYSAVGHGGASGYLALMALFSFATETMRPTALILNLFVSLIAFFQYYRSGYFRWNLFWPFAITSIPAAFLGGLITIDAHIYKKILAILLFFSVVKLLGMKFKTKELLAEQNTLLSLFIGAIIGLFSGMIGIGGGIILSPIVLLLNWANMKQTAALSALFIFVNSLSGLAGLLVKGFEYKNEMGLMLVIAFVGGIVGSYYGARKFENAMLSKILAVVLIMAAVKLFFT